MAWYFWIGLIASAGIAVFTLPQLISLIKTKNTTHINLLMYSIYLIGCFCFLSGGILLVCQNNLSAGLPLVVAQSISGLISSIIWIWKLKDVINHKKQNTTKKELNRSST